MEIIIEPKSLHVNQVTAKHDECIIIGHSFNANCPQEHLMDLNDRLEDYSILLEDSYEIDGAKQYFCIHDIWWPNKDMNFDASIDYIKSALNIDVVAYLSNYKGEDADSLTSKSLFFKDFAQTGIVIYK